MKEEDSIDKYNQKIKELIKKAEIEKKLIWCEFYEHFNIISEEYHIPKDLKKEIEQNKYFLMCYGRIFDDLFYRRSNFTLKEPSEYIEKLDKEIRMNEEKNTSLRNIQIEINDWLS